MRSMLLAATAALIPAVAAAQQPVGYRGGFSEPTGTVAPRVIEIDAGSSVVEAGDARTLRVGELTVHAGATSWLEVRLHLNSYAWSDLPAGDVSGRQDPGLGLAARVSRNGGLRPDAVLVAHAATPTGSLPGRERSWRPTAKLSLGWALPAELYLASTLGATRASEGGDRYEQAFGSLWLGRPVSQRVSLFGEVYGFDRESRAGEAAGYVAGGVAVLLTDWLHMDVNGSTRLDGPAPARSLGIGFKTRW